MDEVDYFENWLNELANASKKKDMIHLCPQANLPKAPQTATWFSFLSVIMRRLKTAGVFLTPPQSTLLPNCPQTPQILHKLTKTMSS
ncbi:hypothetical protein AOLI_G00324990 [Acnodon oligacanthus]